MLNKKRRNVISKDDSDLRLNWGKHIQLEKTITNVKQMKTKNPFVFDQEDKE